MKQQGNLTKHQEQIIFRALGLDLHYSPSIVSYYGSFDNLPLQLANSLCAQMGSFEK